MNPIRIKPPLWLSSALFLLLMPVPFLLGFALGAYEQVWFRLVSCLVFLLWVIIQTVLMLWIVRQFALRQVEPL